MRTGIVKKNISYISVDICGHLTNDLSNGKSHHLKAVVVNRRSVAGRFRPLLLILNKPEVINFDHPSSKCWLHMHTT